VTQVDRAIAAPCFDYDEADYGARWLQADRGPWRLYCILKDGKWHTSSELHAAYNAAKVEWGDGLLAGWSWDGAKAQLKKRGFRIESKRIVERREFRHRLTHYPDDRTVKPEPNPQLQAAKERTEREIAERSESLSGSCVAASGHVGGYAPENREGVHTTPSNSPEPLAGDPRGGWQQPSCSPVPRPSPSRWQDRVGASGAARKAGGEQNTLWEERG